MKSALVTGAAGFIGSHLVEGLLKKNYKVVGIDNLVNGQLKNLQNSINNDNFSFYEIDIRDKQSLNNLDNSFSHVFHLAGMADIVPSIENPEEYYEVNVSGTYNILELVRKKSIKKFLYAASSSCYGIPDNYPTNEFAEIRPQYPYALTKFLGEQLVMHWADCYKLPNISLRLFNVYGPKSRTTGTYGAVFGVFLAQKLKKQPFTIVGDGEQTRDFTFVTDVVNAFIAAAESGIKNEIFNVGSGSHYSINSLVDLLAGEKTYIPKRPGEPDCTFADIKKINSLLGWYPTVNFEDGVKEMIKNIEMWDDAPLWDKDKIEKATESWFEYLGEQND